MADSIGRLKVFSSIPGIAKGLVCFFVAAFATYLGSMILTPIFALNWIMPASGALTKTVAQFGFYIGIFFGMFVVTYYRMFGKEEERKEGTADRSYGR